MSQKSESSFFGTSNGIRPGKGVTRPVADHWQNAQKTSLFTPSPSHQLVFTNKKSGFIPLKPVNMTEINLRRANEKLVSVEKEKAKALKSLKKAQKSSEDAKTKLREALAAQKRAEQNTIVAEKKVEVLKSELDEKESALRKANEELFNKVVSENKELLMKVEALTKLVDDDQEYDKLTDCAEEGDLKMWECIKIDDTLVEKYDDVGKKMKKKALLGKIGCLLKKGSGDDQ